MEQTAGGLLSAHTLCERDPSVRAVPLRQRCHVPLRTSSRDTCGRWQLVRGYSGGLLSLALDLGTRLLAAFDTPTGAVAQRTMRCTRWDVL
jgi:hypothetical protein